MHLNNTMTCQKRKKRKKEEEKKKLVNHTNFLSCLLHWDFYAMLELEKGFKVFSIPVETLFPTWKTTKSCTQLFMTRIFRYSKYKEGMYNFFLFGHTNYHPDSYLVYSDFICGKYHVMPLNCPVIKNYCYFVVWWLVHPIPKSHRNPFSWIYRGVFTLDL